VHQFEILLLPPQPTIKAAQTIDCAGWNWDNSGPS
jgi:hypothetical protein